MRKKLRMSQVNRKTRVSMDYVNVISLVFSALDVYYNHNLDIFHKVPKLEKYTERYHPEEFVSVVNDKNRGAITRLDDVIDKLNALLEKGSKNLKEYVPLVQEGGKIIFGYVDRTAGMQDWGKAERLQYKTF